MRPIPEVTRARILGLDGLRALAVIFVFLEHKTNFGGLLGGGEAGVMLFFVLSGYLITGILLNSRGAVERADSTSLSEIVRFFYNRSFRIFPPYYAMLAILLVTALALGERVSPMWSAAYITYTTNIASAYFEKSWAPLGHLWSLAVEEQFYILAAPLFLLTPRRYAKFIVTGIFAAGATTWLILRTLNAEPITFATDSFINFSMLGFGSLLALSVRPNGGTGSIAILTGLALLVVPTLFGLVYPPLQAFKLFVSPDQIDALYATLIVWGVLTNQNSPVVAFLNWTPLRLLGRVSYAFYLWHYVIDFDFTAQTIQGLTGSQPVTATAIVLLEFATTVAISTASWWLLESPALKLRDRLLSRPAHG